MGWIENMLYACNLKFLNYESKKNYKESLYTIHISNKVWHTLENIDITLNMIHKYTTV